MEKQDQQLLRNMYRLISDYSQEMILFFDREGMIIECSQSAKDKLCYGEDILSTRIADVFRKAVKLSEGIPTISKRYQEKAMETLAYRKNQTCFEVELKIVTEDRASSYLGICTATDISDKKRAQRSLKNTMNELKSSQKFKNEFMANVSHELKTPVNGICGLTEYLLKTELNTNQKDSLHLIQRCCSNMNVLINDLLDYAKIINNKLVLEKREFNFRNLIDYLISVNINRINDKDINLIVNISNDVPEIVIGDEYRISQVINNLLSNAMKFTSIGQVALEIGMTAQKNEVVELFFMVMDTGIGISKENIDKLFISFSQVDGSISRRFGGTGLGLSICKLLVEAMGGTISVESEVGKGSTFFFSIRLETPMNPMRDAMPMNGHGYTENGRGTEKISAHNVYQGTDYLGELLREADDPSSVIHAGCMTEVYGRKRLSDPMQEYKDWKERLIVCIEMESWEKAEEAAVYLKGLLPMHNKILMDAALRLILSVRKENYEKSKLMLQELEKLTEEMIHWKT